MICGWTWSNILPSSCPSFCLSGCCLGIRSLLVFLKFWRVTRNPNEVVRDRPRYFRKFFFCAKTLGNGSKIYVICCVSSQIPYLGKIFLRCRSKSSQPIRLQDFQIKYFFRTNWWNDLIFCMLIQIPKMHPFLHMAKNGCGLNGLGTLKLTIPRMNRWN